MIKNKYLNLIILGLITIPTTIATTSCNKQKIITNDQATKPDDNENIKDEIKEEIKDENINNDSNQNEENNENENLIPINIEKIQINWIEGFKEKEKTFLETTKDFVFQIGDIIFDDEKYQMKYLGDYKNTPSYSLYIKSIKKYYINSIEAKYDLLQKYFSKNKIQKLISDKTIEEFEKNMVVKYEIKDDNFFVPIDTSDESLTFDKNEILNFKSSWGVANSQKKDINFNIKISSTKIREILFGAYEQNLDNFFIKNIEATDLYLLPKILVINEPINYFDFNVNVLKNNLNDKTIDLTNDEKSILNVEIPGKNNTNYKLWAGKINNQIVNGKIVNSKYENGLSNTIVQMLNSNNKEYENVINRINLSSQKDVEEYVNEIFTKGKRIKINKNINFIDNKNDLLSLNFNSSIKAGANAANLLGDRTTACLYQISSILKMKLNFEEYKKF